MADKTEKAGNAGKSDEKSEKKPKKAPPEKAERKGGRGGSASGREEPAAKVVSSVEAVTPRFMTKYQKDVVSALTKQFSYKNPNQVPRLTKIVINMGLGAAVTNPKIVDAAVEELRAITGQKPVVTRAKKAIASFKLRAGIPIGAMVTLRSGRMWEFLDRLVTLALPRTRDFRGVSRKAFDGKGNYTLGLREQIIFPEINYDRIDVIKGLNISFVTTARTDEEGRALLAHLGMPFRAA
jgi:large subunit ribosomal protein L5